MLETRFTQLVGCTIPLQQAGMGVALPAELSAAVSEVGGLGMLACGGTGITPDTVTRRLERGRALTSRPLGANFIVRDDVPPIEHASFEVAASLVRVVELFLWAAPDPRVFDLIHQGGALVCCQVGSAEEARRAAGAGADLIVAQGIEAGGHVRGTIGLLPLLGEVLETVDVPVLAAGGIGTARAVAAALAAGAEGVRVGTRFVAATEAGAHPTYQQGLVDAQAEDTVYTTAFAVGWPAPHRVLRSALTAAEAFDGDVVGEHLQPDGTRAPTRRFAINVPLETTTGRVDAMSLWAGESVGGVTRVQPAAEIVRELADGAERLLRRWA